MKLHIKESESPQDTLYGVLVYDTIDDTHYILSCDKKDAKKILNTLWKAKLIQDDGFNNADSKIAKAVDNTYDIFSNVNTSNIRNNVYTASNGKSYTIINTADIPEMELIIPSFFLKFVIDET